MYFQFECDESTVTAYITPQKESSQSLILGEFIDPARQKLPFRFTYHDPTGSPLFDYYPVSELMSKRLIAALQAAGVDNLQTFEAELIDESTGAINREYCNVNILGLVSCANVPLSKTSELGSSYYFHDLVIDSRNVGDLLMFRLAESMMDILVDERIARVVQAGGFRGVILKPVKNAPSQA